MDLLEVIFDEGLHRDAKISFYLRDGLIMYVHKKSLKPVRLTIVNYRRLATLPAILFEGWKALTDEEKAIANPLLASPPVANFIQIDSKTGYGHIARPGILEALTVAA